MLSYDYRDLIGGAVLIAIGSLVAYYALSSYDLGSPRRFGPGMFPTALGVILAGLGVVQLVSALGRQPAKIRANVRPFLAILAGVLWFALVIEPFGMVPAIIGLTIAAVLGDNKIGFWGTLLLGLILSAVGVGIFRIGLNIYIPLYNWPF